MSGQLQTIPKPAPPNPLDHHVLSSCLCWLIERHLEEAPSPQYWHSHQIKGHCEDQWLLEKTIVLLSLWIQTWARNKPLLLHHVRFGGSLLKHSAYFMSCIKTGESLIYLCTHKCMYTYYWLPPGRLRRRTRWQSEDGNGRGFSVCTYWEWISLSWLHIYSYRRTIAQRERCTVHPSICAIMTHTENDHTESVGEIRKHKRLLGAERVRLGLWPSWAWELMVQLQSINTPAGKHCAHFPHPPQETEWLVWLVSCRK